MTLGSTNSVDLTTLLGYTRFLTNTLSNVATITDAQITALLNQEYQELQLLLLAKVNRGWQIKGSVATGNLVDGTNNYTFTTSLSTADVMSIERLELNYNGATNNYVVAQPKKPHAILNPLQNTSNDAAIEATKINPVWWTFGTDTFYIDPIPDANVTSGIKCYLTSLVTSLSASGDEPILIEQAHRLMCYNSAIKWLNTKKRFDLASAHKEERDELGALVVEFYTKRISDTKPSLRTRNENYES